MLQKRRNKYFQYQRQSSLKDMISAVRLEWDKLSFQHPHREYGIKVLEKLFQLQFSSLPKFEVSLNLKPSPAHIIYDLQAQEKPRYRNQLLDFDDDDTRFLDFITGWVALAHDPGVNVTDPVQIPYSVSDVLATERGLDNCGITLPDCLSDDDVAVRPIDFGNVSKPRLTTTLSPAGSITDPHIDGTGSGLLLFQVLGSKLLFTWPASSGNLKWMETRHGIKKGPLKLFHAIDEMSEMNVTFLTGHESVVLEPGMIHAVVSPENSAISGWDFVKAAWLSSNDVQRQMMWEASQAKKQKDGLLGDLYDLGRYLEDDLQLWTMLGSRLGLEKGGRHISAMVESIRASR